MDRKNIEKRFKKVHSCSMGSRIRTGLSETRDRISNAATGFYNFITS